MIEDKYLLLLTRDFNGQLDPAERELLGEWLDADPAHREAAAYYRAIWAAAAGESAPVDFDPEREFGEILAKINRNQIRKTPLRSHWGALARVAALFVVCFGAWWLYQQYAGATEERVVVQNASLPVQEVTLLDGSRVWLHQGATLSYPRAFQAKDRSVALAGEAYFSVTHMESKPFRVHTANGGLVEVLGTEFSVNTGNGKRETVVVRSGKVRYQTNEQDDGRILTAFQKASFDAPANTVTLHELTSLNELSWQRGGLEFVQTPLSQVVRDLEQYYGVPVRLQNQSMADCPHTAPLTNQPLEQVLKSLQLAYEFRLEKSVDQGYVLLGGRCD